MSATTRKLGGKFQVVYAVTLIFCIAVLSSASAQMLAQPAPPETLPTNLLNAYRYAFQAYARDDTEAAAQEYNGEPGAAKRDTLRQQLNVTSEQFIPFQNMSLDFRREQGAFEDRVNEVVTADRTSHPAANRLSAEAAGRIRALSAELLKEESALIDAIHQSLGVSNAQRLDVDVLRLYSAAHENVAQPTLRPTSFTRSPSGIAPGGNSGANPDLQIYDPGGPDACNGLDPEEEAEEEAACDLNGGNYSTSACTCLMPIYGGGGGGGGNSPTPADNTPIFTGIDPSVWISGSTTSVTFKGQYFGTNSPTLAFSPGAGIGYTLSSYNDSQIIATVNVATGTPNEDVGVSVTNNGYGGSAFYGGSSGASPTSGPTYATVASPQNTPEITVIAWVNGNAPDLAMLPSGENSELQSILQNSTAAQQATCAVEITDWVGRDPDEVRTSADSAYANAWVVKNSANSAPPTVITPSVQQSAGNFRLFNDFGHGGGFYQVGNTPDPCGTGMVPTGWTTGQASPYMGAGGASPSGEVYQLAEGRVGTIGQLASETINGNRTVPYIWSLIEFNSSGNPTYSNVGMFPTYSVYVNGNLAATYPQSSVASFILNNNTYQLIPSSIQ